MEKKLVCVKDSKGKWGAIDRDGNFVIPLNYADCKVIDDVAYFLKKKKDEGATIMINLIDGTMREYHFTWTCPIPKYTEAFHELLKNSQKVGSLRKIQKNGMWALWNMNDKLLTDYEYDDIENVTTYYNSSDPYHFLLKKNGLCGVMDTNGKLLVPVSFFKINRTHLYLSDSYGFFIDAWICHYTEEDYEKSHWHGNKVFSYNGEDVTDLVWTPEFERYDKYDMFSVEFKIKGKYTHLFLVKKGDYYGVFDIKKKQEIIPCEYEKIDLNTSGVLSGHFTCSFSGKFGLFDTEGNKVFDCKYLEISCDGNSVIVLTDEGVDIYDEHFNLLEKNVETYDECSGFHEGFMTCMKDGVEFLRDKEGKRYLEGKYDIRDLSPDSDGYVYTQIENMLETEHFSHGLMPVCKDYSYGYIDTNFNEVIPLQYSFASNFNEDGYACVKLSDTLIDSNGPWALIDTKGNIVVQHEGDQFRYDIASGLIRVHSRREQWGIIDTKGNVIIKGESEPLVEGPNKWNHSDDIYCYKPSNYHGYIIVKKGHEPFVINSESKVEIGHYISDTSFKPEYSSCHRYPVTVADGKWVAVDENLDIVIPEHYDEMGIFTSGRSLVKKRGHWGAINTEGKVVIPLKYDYIEDCDNGYALIMKDKKYGLVDWNGNVVTECENDYIFWQTIKDFGYAFVKKGRKIIKVEI